MLSTEPAWKKPRTEYMNEKITFNFHDPNCVHDRVINIDGQKFYVISKLLMLSSEYFADLFNDRFTDSNYRQIPLKQVNTKDFNNFLLAIYPGDFAPSGENYASLFTLGNRYQVPVVQKLCYKFILTNFDSLNKMQLIQVAFEHDLEDVKKKLASFIAGSENTVIGEACSECSFVQTSEYCTCKHIHLPNIRKTYGNLFIHDNFEAIRYSPIENRDFIFNSSYFKFP